MADKAMLINEIQVMLDQIKREKSNQAKGANYLQKLVEERDELIGYSEQLGRAPFSKARKSSQRLQLAHLNFDQWQERNQLTLQNYAEMCGFKILQKGQNEVTGQVSFDDRFFTFFIKFPCVFEGEEC